jgi:hypothetical protein
VATCYPEVPIVFAGSRKFAEEWAYRFFGAAVGHSGAGTKAPDHAQPEICLDDSLPL